MGLKSLAVIIVIGDIPSVIDSESEVSAVIEGVGSAKTGVGKGHSVSK